MIQGYEQGSDITLLDTLYQRPRKQEDGKYSKDILTLTFEDNTTKKKHHVDLIEPDYEFYKIKDDIYVDYNMLFAPKEICEPVVVPYNSILKEIASMTGNLDQFYSNINNGQRQENEKLHTLYHIMNSDMDIEDHYRFRFSKMYQNVPKLSLSKGFFDIETDNINDVNDFPELGMFPINALSYISTVSKKISVFLLRKSERPNPLIKEFEDKVRSNPKGMTEKLKNYVMNHVGGEERYRRRYKMQDYTYEYLFFDEEIELIATFFQYVNTDEPDFMLAWNMPFDIPYIVERIKVLGYDPRDIMCHPEYKYKYVEYYIDNLPEHDEFKKKGHWFKIAGKSVYIDQLVNFASRRSGTKFQRYSLDYIGGLISRVKKLDYSHLTTHIPSLPYIDYETFVFYNVCDTIVQYCIDIDTGDVDYMYKKCNYNFTRYDKCHRQTIYLTNRATAEFDKQGFIIGNNCAKFKAKQGKYPGAYVHDPTKTDNTYKLRVGQFVINMCRNADDFDFKSLYPSETLQNNISATTQIGRIMIDHNVHDRENPFRIDNMSRGGIFIEDYQSGNVIEFCSRWLHFAGYLEMMRDLEEYMYLIHNRYLTFYNNEPIPMVIPLVNRTLPQMVKEIHPENREMIQMVNQLHVPLSKNLYNELFPEKRFVVG